LGLAGLIDARMVGEREDGRQQSQAASRRRRGGRGVESWHPGRLGEAGPPRKTSLAETAESAV